MISTHRCITPATLARFFVPENPLLPNYKWVPIGYHGRATTIVVSGTAVRRPWGQLKPPSAERPQFAPARRLDYEVEVGALVGVGNEMGEAIPLAQAGGHIFGLCLVNDWSARDIQSWEYQPLGPFLAKSFATSVSPWIVTAEALVRFAFRPWHVRREIRSRCHISQTRTISSTAASIGGGSLSAIGHHA